MLGLFLLAIALAAAAAPAGPAAKPILVDSSLPGPPIEPWAAIGSATMLPNRSLRLELWEGTRELYPPNHPDYPRILGHLPGIRPGDHRPMPPWRPASSPAADPPHPR